MYEQAEGGGVDGRGWEFVNRRRGEKDFSFFSLRNFSLFVFSFRDEKEEEQVKPRVLY